MLDTVRIRVCEEGLRELCLQSPAQGRGRMSLSKKSLLKRGDF